MSRVLHDFKCPNGHIFEDLVDSETREQPCQECEELAKRVFLVAPKVDWLALGASAGASPEAIARFDKMHKEQKAKEERCLERNGDYGPRPGAD